MIVTEEGHFAPHRASRDGHGRRAAPAGRDGAGADRPGEHASESRAPPRRRLPPQRRHLRELAAQGRRAATSSSRPCSRRSSRSAIS